MTTTTATKEDAKKFANLIGPTDAKLDREVREILITARVGLLYFAAVVLLCEAISYFPYAEHFSSYFFFFFTFFYFTQLFNCFFLSNKVSSFFHKVFIFMIYLFACFHHVAAVSFSLASSRSLFLFSNIRFYLFQIKFSKKKYTCTFMLF